MSTTLECFYEYAYVFNEDTKYFCDVENNLNINSSESAIITKATGSQNDSKNNDDVLGFNAHRINIEFFPQGLEKFFKNLIEIYIIYGPIRKIHPRDLKGFSKLEI